MIQTWLPLPDFRESVSRLSMAHLSLQRLHVLELIEELHEVAPDQSALPVDYEHTNLSEHPLVDMWRGYEAAVCQYGLFACDEWGMRRGKRDPYYEPIMAHLECETEAVNAGIGKPNWFGDIDFHLSHQSALLLADFSHYSGAFLADTSRVLMWPKSDHAA